jgi:nucleoside-diphosphate-sugar epimerase
MCEANTKFLPENAYKTLQAEEKYEPLVPAEARLRELTARSIVCYSMDCRKIQEGLGWKPTTPLEEGLRWTIEWYKANSHWLADARDGEYRRYYE